MIDSVERAEWFEDYLAAALDHPEAWRAPRRAAAWAKSMSLIAEQFTDNDEGKEKADA